MTSNVSTVDRGKMNVAQEVSMRGIQRALFTFSDSSRPGNLSEVLVGLASALPLECEDPSSLIDLAISDYRYTLGRADATGCSAA